MKGFIKIKSGSYRGEEIQDQVFPLVKSFRQGANGGFVTVDGAAHFGRDRVRVRVESDDFELVNGDEYSDMPVTKNTAPAKKSEKTDEEIIERIAERFEILDEMTAATIEGSIRGVIVSGPPGVGKSYGVERQLDKYSLMDKVANRPERYGVVKGTASAVALYKTLYRYSDKGSVVVFDDCDSILLDDVCLNLLKAALDSGRKRRLSWLTGNKVLENEGIPDSFDFHGSVIFITNLKFDRMKSQKLRDHLDALQSRCHYLDLTLDTMRDRILRIRQIARTGQLFRSQNLGDAAQDEIVEFMVENKDRLREVSLRMAVKVAELYKSFPARWQAMAETTCMRNAG